MPGRAIFRERAVQHHLYKQEKHILPGFVSPPVFLFLWITIGLSIVLFSLAWNTRIPVSISGTGIIVRSTQSNQMIALLLLPSEQLHAIHRGQPVQLQIGADDQLAHSSITSVAPEPLSPDEIRHRYHLDGTLAPLVTQPAVAVEVTLDTTPVTSLYLGSSVRAEVQVGSQRVLSVLPLVGSMIGE